MSRIHASIKGPSWPAVLSLKYRMARERVSDKRKHRERGEVGVVFDIRDAFSDKRQ